MLSWMGIQPTEHCVATIRMLGFRVQIGFPGSYPVLLKLKRAGDTYYAKKVSPQFTMVIVCYKWLRTVDTTN